MAADEHAQLNSVAVAPVAVAPVAMEPDAMEPDAMEPDAMEPDAVEPDAMEPDAIEPDAIEPDVIEPDGVATPRLHHVNLGIAPQDLDAETAFLVGVIGYQQMIPDDKLVARGALWFETGDGTQVHLSKDPEHRPAAKAHVAVDYGDRLVQVQRRLAERSIPNRVADAGDGLRVVLCRDPAGNLWELRGRVDTRDAPDQTPVV